MYVVDGGERRGPRFFPKRPLGLRVFSTLKGCATRGVRRGAGATLGAATVWGTGRGEARHVGHRPGERPPGGALVRRARGGARHLSVGGEN